MGQINITVADHIIAEIDQIAEVREMRRPELLRALMDEAIDAHNEGRLAFAAGDGPSLDTSVSGLMLQLQEAIIELDRAQRENARLTGKLITKWNGGEEANRLAQQRLSSQMIEHNTLAYSPFAEKMDEAVGVLAKLPEGVTHALENELASIGRQIERNNKLAAQPRTQHNFVLGERFSFRYAAILSSMIAFAGLLIGLHVLSWNNWTSQKIAGRMIDDAYEICVLINNEHGVSDCEVPKDQRRLALKIIAAKEEQ